MNVYIRHLHVVVVLYISIVSLPRLNLGRQKSRDPVIFTPTSQNYINIMGSKMLSGCSNFYN